MGSITIGTKTVTGINIGTGIDVGTKTTTITENGTYDVDVFGYATNSISVAVSGGGVDTDFLCFTAGEANSTVGLTIGEGMSTPELYISTDNQQTFTQWDGSTVTLENVGDKMYIYGDNVQMCEVSSIYNNFTMSGSIAASGDVTSLLNRKGVDYLPSFAFCYLFKDCTSLTQAPELPATQLSSYCYSNMFYGCTSLTTAPALPATTLSPYCYGNMFQGCTALTTAPTLPATTMIIYSYTSMFRGCTALTTAPALPATTLATGCYQYMFKDCTSLTQAPALPATTLSVYCYQQMFQGCTALTTAPALPATTLAQSCYYYMFNDCTSLNYIEVYATEWNTSRTSNWVANVAATGTFVNSEGINIPVGTSGIPSGWTVVTSPPKTLTLTYSGYDFSWSTSDGRSGSMTSGDTDYALGILSGQTVTFTTAGGRQRLSVNGDDQCVITLDGYTYVYGYDGLNNGDVVSCEYFSEPCS